MKIAVVFLVVALSSFSGLIHSVGGLSFIGCEAVGSQVSKEDVVDMAVAVSMLENRKEGNLTEILNETLLKEIASIISKLRCFHDSFRRSLDMDEATDPTPDMASHLVGTLKPVLEQAGLTKPAYNAIYDATKYVVNPKCLPMLLGGGFRDLLLDVKTEVNHIPTAKFPTGDLRSIAVRASCFLEDGPMEDPKLSEVVNNMTQDKNSSLWTFTGSAAPIGFIKKVILYPLERHNEPST